MYVKIGAMSESLYKSFEASFATQPILYHFRDIVVKEESLPLFSMQYVSNNLYPDSQNPLKVIFAFVTTKAKLGDYKLNPFGFYRSWKVTKGLDRNVSSEIENCYLREEVTLLRAEMRRNWQVLMDKLTQTQSASTEQNSSEQTSSGPVTEQSSSSSTRTVVGNTVKNKQLPNSVCLAKGRSLRPRQNPKQRPNLTEVESEDEQEVSGDESFSTANSVVQADNTVGLETEQIVYIKNLQLELNSSPLDQFGINSTQDEAVSDYVRMLQTNGFYNSLQSNNISYENFRSGIYNILWQFTYRYSGGW